MKEYRLDPSALPKRKRLATMIAVAAILFGAGVGIVLPWYLSPEGSPVFLKLVPLLFISGLAAYGVQKIHRQLTRQWEGFSVSCDDNRLIMKDPLAGEQRVLRTEVQKIEKIRGKGLMIHAEGHPALLLSEMLLGYEELEAQVKGWNQ